MGGCELELLASEKGSIVDSRKHGNEFLSFMKWKKFLYYLTDYQLLKDSAPLVSLVSWL
jgi:hypothetical protein